MTREAIADIFDQIAVLLELKGENPFKIRAYRTGAETVRSFAGDFVELARQNKLKGIKGLGDALQEKAVELVATGKLVFFEKLRGEFPEGIFELFELSGLGPKKIALLYETLGIGSIPQLAEALETGKLTGLPGFAEKSVQKLKESIAFRASHADTFRRDQAADFVEQLLEALRSLEVVSQVQVAGSFRRGKEVVRDLDFLVATKSPGEVMEFFVSQPGVHEVLAKGETKSSVRLENGLQVDLRAVTNAEFPYALAYFTGSKEHNVAMRGRALKQGWTLNEYRFAPTDPNSPAPAPQLNTEQDIYAFLGLEYVPPELRENTGEIEAAESGKLPKLVELAQLRGTFHNHTTASDGSHSLRQMAEAAMSMGLSYLGIADHSKSSFQANGLDEKRLRQQLEDIRLLNDEYASEGFRIFTGSEVDILKDGTLDFPDDLLAELDYTVASVHNAMTLPEEEMTARILRAVANPHVTMLGHLTGRLLLKREPYAVNISKILDACAANGTVVELNANPWRLDLDWRWWKLARDKGVKCSINPDAHEMAGLADLTHGVSIARKGWLRREDVINCLKLDEVVAFLQQKRQRNINIS
jgi:DNA polymerase (family X)